MTRIRRLRAKNTMHAIVCQNSLISKKPSYAAIKEAGPSIQQLRIGRVGVELPTINGQYRLLDRAITQPS
jgi:hypothetical protein